MEAGHDVQRFNHLQLFFIDYWTYSNIKRVIIWKYRGLKAFLTNQFKTTRAYKLVPMLLRWNAYHCSRQIFNKPSFPA